MEQINLILSSNRSEVSRVEEILTSLHVNISQEKKVNFQIAASEALVNAIVHGNKEDLKKKVEIAIRYDENSIELIIADQGFGFDINKLPDPTNPENLLKESGRGIFIIRSLVDEFKCESSEKGTVLSLKSYSETGGLF